MGAAHDLEEGRTVGIGEPLDLPAPRGRPALVADQTARRQHAAAGPHDGVRPLPRPAQGAGQRLVEQAEAARHLAVPHQDQAEVGHRGQLHVEVARAPALVHRSAQQLDLNGGVLGRIPLHQPQPPQQAGIAAQVRSAPGPREPAAGDDRVVQVRQIADAHVDGHHRGLDEALVSDVRGVGPLAVGQALPDPADPPERRAHPGQRRAGLARGDGRGELVPRVVPAAAAQRVLARPQRRVGAHRSMIHPHRHREWVS